MADDHDPDDLTPPGTHLLEQRVEPVPPGSPRRPPRPSRPSTATTPCSPSNTTETRKPCADHVLGDFDPGTIVTVTATQDVDGRPSAVNTDEHHDWCDVAHTTTRRQRTAAMRRTPRRRRHTHASTWAPPPRPPRTPVGIAPASRCAHGPAFPGRRDGAERRPAAPKGLGRRGGRTWRAVVGVYDFGRRTSW